MTNRFNFILACLISVLASCKNQPSNVQNPGSVTTDSTAPILQPNFNYNIEIPAGWTTRDTTLPDGMLIRFLLPPAELHNDYPTGNILVANMEERNIDDFTSSNINYLKANMPGVTVLEKGVFNAAGVQCRWFTYIKEQNGIKREMINYIIPSNGFAYMVTFGSNKGSLHKYRQLFDDIARSVKG